MNYQEERTCQCGNKFTAWIHPEYNPYDYICSDCRKKNAWYEHMRLLHLNPKKKIRCIKCGWKLGYKDCQDYDENIIHFKCKCCGLTFGLWHPEYSYYDY